MRPGLIFLISAFLCLHASLLPAAAQLPPVKTDLKPGAASQGAAGCSETEASSCAEAAAKILPLVMGPSPLEGNLRRLTDEIGGRVTGSPQMKQAVEWALAAFHAAGVDVHAEKYTLPLTWSEGETRLEILGPEKFPVRLVSTGWSPPIPGVGIEAPLVDVGYGAEQEFARAGSVSGAILLVHSDIGSTWADLFNEYLKPPDIIARAIKGDRKSVV